MKMDKNEANMKNLVKNVTLKDIAQQLDLSEATVSLAINNKSGVSEKTKIQVRQCAEELGYIPNPLARALATNQSMTIGLVCPDPENPFYGKMMKLMSIYCNYWGYSLVLSVSDNDPLMEAKIIKNFIAKRFDGIIIFPLDIHKNTSEVFSVLKKHEIPFVFAISYYEGFENDCVMTDYEEGSYQLTKLLLKSGHREILYLVTEEMDIPVTRLRLDGYKRAYLEAGLKYKPEWSIGCKKADGESAYYMTQKYLNEKSKPDAILALNDYMANGVKKAILDCGYRIPEDISLAGYDASFNELLFEHPITTVRQNMDRIARESINMLMKRINPEFALNLDVNKKIPPELVIRGTIRL